MARSKRTRQRRKARQRVVRRYVKAREDAQLAGVLETSPAGAVRGERVDPRNQGFQPLPGLIRAALRNHWATPNDAKVRAVDELIAVVADPETEPHMKVTAAHLLLEADQTQWERDHLEQAGEARGEVKIKQPNSRPVILTQQMVLEAVLEEARAEPTPAQEEAERPQMEGGGGC